MMKWITPVAFFLSSLIAVALSLLRLMSKSRRFKKQQYYDSETIRSLI
ncbi:MAG: hypothetical protein M3258_03785 [Thermoproteota archaeon]|nr:hypothetical protein [Thermoproteota archaeon]